MHTATEHPMRYFYDRKFDMVSQIPVQRNNSSVGAVKFMVTKATSDLNNMLSDVLNWRVLI